MNRLTNREEEILICLYRIAAPSATVAEVYREYIKSHQMIIRNDVNRTLNNLTTKGYVEKLKIDGDVILFKPLIGRNEYRREKIRNLCDGLFKDIEELREFINGGSKI